MARLHRTRDGIGAIECGLERGGAIKHIGVVAPHIRRRRYAPIGSPRRNILVERRSATKHIIHISRRSVCVPIPNGLVERRSISKHSIHMIHKRSIPSPNVLVERRSGIKHIPHIRHFFCVPPPNVLVERRSESKHISHITHLRCVPLRNVAVECTFIAKALISTSSPSTHIRHQTRVPIRHRPVIITRRPRRALSSNFCA